jgi:hypothetical protein
MKPMTARIENYIRMEARGEPREEIIRQLFGEDALTDEKKRNAATVAMWRWRQRPDFQPIWDDEMRARVRRRVPAAVGRLEKQVDDDNGWLANKAANDYIGLAKTVGVFQTEEKAVNVRIEGLPDIGSPDDE